MNPPKGARAGARVGLMPHQVHASTNAPRFDMTRNFTCKLHVKLPTVSTQLKQ
jgi:hypothetical protein